MIVDVDRLIDAGLSGYQTASAAVLTEANEMVPAHCITFAFCTVTGAVLYNDTNLHWEDYVAEGPSRGGARPHSEDEAEAEVIRDELLDRAAARDPDSVEWNKFTRL